MVSSCPSISPPIRYERSDLGSFLDSSGNMKPLLVFVGRFLGFKRVPLLLDAVTRANRQLARNGDDESRFNLLVLGGVPGEWEGEHPHTAATRLGLRNSALQRARSFDTTSDVAYARRTRLHVLLVSCHLGERDRLTPSTTAL